MVPGTNMTFAGIPRGSERADLIAYLNTQSDNPAPLPKAAEARRRPEQPPAAECGRALRPRRMRGSAAESRQRRT